MKKINKLFNISLVSLFLIVSTPIYALTKDETVYSKLNSDGSVKKTIVSEYLKNDEETINDQTNLKNILNINGSETYELEGSNIVWDAKGKDIYYQGESDEKLPVNLDVSYKLNGKEIKLEDLLGKEGKVEITLKYTNNEKHTVLVNGRYETLYTPFIVTLGTIIPNENNSNIEVVNGRVVSNGKNSIVVALASPGLYESLDIDTLKDFDTITLSYNTTSFELSSIYSVITSNLIKKDDLDVFDRLDTVYTKVNTLSSASKQLVEGSNNLVAAINKLNSGTNTLANGINDAYLGSKKINMALEAGIENTENKTIDETSVKEQAIAGVDTYITTLEAQVNAAETPDLLYLYNNNICEVSPVAQCSDPDVQKYLRYKKALDLLSNENIKNVVKSVTSEVTYSAVSKTANQAKEETLNSLNTLNENIGQLTSGLDKLNSGAQSLVNGTNALTSGVQLLADGIAKFDSEGIGSISNLVNGDVKTTEEKIKTLIELGKTYDTFTLKSDKTEGETKFVLIVDSAKNNKVVKENKTETKNENIFDKIKKIIKK